MADYGYFDYAADIAAQQVDWASGSAPLPFVAETVGSMMPPSLSSLGKVMGADSRADKYKAAYEYAFARDFAHRHRRGAAFLLKSGFTGIALPSAIRVGSVHTPQATE